MGRPEVTAAGVGTCEVSGRTRPLVPGEGVAAALAALLGRLADQRAVAAEVEGARPRLRNREAVDTGLEARVRRPGSAASAVVEHDPDRRQGLEGVECGLVVRLILDRIMWQRYAGYAHRGLVDDRRYRGRAGRVLRFLPGHVELKEVEPAVERLRVERVDVEAVGEGEPLPAGPGEAVGEVRAVRAGLLVVELAGEEYRDVDAV